MELSVILPAYLEEENLRLLLPRIKQTVGEFTSNFEILVIDTMKPMDGSALACKEHDVRYINRVGGNDYGDAIRTGIDQASGKYIVFMDADGSHHPSFIKKLFSFKDEYDIVIASRYVDGGQTENSPALILMSRIVNWGYSFVLNIKCKDVSNSFKLYKGEHLKNLQLKCKNFDIVEEIIFKIIRDNRKAKIKIKEIPFVFKQRMFGKTKRNLLSFIITYIFTLIKLRFSRTRKGTA